MRQYFKAISSIHFGKKRSPRALLLLLVLFAFSCERNELTIERNEVLSVDNSYALVQNSNLPINVSADFIWGINGHPLYYSPSEYAIYPISAQLNLLKEHQMNYYRIDARMMANGVPSNPSNFNTTLGINTPGGSGDTKVLPILKFYHLLDTISSAATNEIIGENLVNDFFNYNSQYANKIDVYALDNELDLKLILDRDHGTNISDFDINKLERVRYFMKGMIKSIRSKDPDAKIIINTTHGTWVGYLEYLDILDYDIIGLHKYTVAGNNYKGLLENYTELGDNVINYYVDNFNKDIWITEINRKDGSGDVCGIIDQQTVMDSFIDELNVLGFGNSNVSRIKAFFPYELLDQPHLTGNDTVWPQQDYGIMDHVGINQYEYKPISHLLKYRIEETKYGYEDFIYSLLWDLNQRDPLVNSGYEYWTSRFKILQNQETVMNEIIPEESYSRFIESLFLQLHERPYDQPGLDYWENEMLNGATREEVIIGFCNSTEFWTAAGGTNALFVDRIYDNLFQASETEVGITKQFWVSYLNTLPQSQRWKAIELMIETEFYLKKFIKEQYVDLLNRNLIDLDNDEGIDFYHGQMQNGLNQQDLIKTLILSKEYWKRSILEGYERKVPGHTFDLWPLEIPSCN